MRGRRISLVFGSMAAIMGFVAVSTPPATAFFRFRMRLAPDQERTNRMPSNDRLLSLDLSGAKIPAAVSLPVGPAPKWGLVLIPGSFNSDLDGNYSFKDGNPFEARPHMYADLARQLAGCGVAVLRFARAGLTISDPAKAGRLREFAGRVDVAAEACRALRAAVPGLRRVAVAGHSEGGVVALLLLTTRLDVAVDAMISLSGPGQRFFDIMIEQSVSTARGGFIQMGPMRVPAEAYKESFRYVREGRPVPDELRKILPSYAVAAMPLQAQAYLREYDRVDPGQTMARVSVPVLIVQGGSDTSVLPENAARLLAAREGKTPPAERAFFGELNHFYKVVPPGTDPLANFALATDTDERVARAIAAWLTKQTENKKDR